MGLSGIETTRQGHCRPQGLDRLCDRGLKPERQSRRLHAVRTPQKQFISKYLAQALEGLTDCRLRKAKLPRDIR